MNAHPASSVLDDWMAIKVWPRTRATCLKRPRFNVSSGLRFMSIEIPLGRIRTMGALKGCKLNVS